jgi:H+/Cl- antiporter ClcA
LLGTGFIWVNVHLGMKRKMYINTPKRKILEALFVAFFSASAFYLAVWLWRDNCVTVTSEDTKHIVQFYCTAPNTYNPLATLVFNTSGGTIRQLFSYPNIAVSSSQDGSDALAWNIVVFFFLWYSLSITTYGIWVPGGILVPGIIMGCSIGLLYLELLVGGFGASTNRVGSQSYLAIGASAMLGSYTGLTYSLSVLMVETTQAINLFLPIYIAVFVSSSVGKIFNRSIYEYGLRAK